MEAVPPVPTSERPREAAAVIPADDEQETDVWWGAYASRTMLPGFIVCGLITAGVTAVWLGWVEYHLSELTARYTAYAVIGPLWLFQLGRWLYRILTRTYRLTTRRLYIERTFFHVPARIVDLRRVTDVAVESTALERRLKVGRVRLRTENPQQPDVFLEGVYDPQRIAQQIRTLAKPK
jgi:membrane protein YdbS with pleckstrin-like domain